MRQLLLYLLIMTCGLLQAQEAYIVKTNGEKIAIDPGEHFYDTGRKIKYYSGNGIFPKTIKTEEVQEIADGASVYKVYALDAEKKKLHLYKIVATSPDKTLLVRFIEPAANSSSGGLGMEYFIVDKHFTVLDSGEIPPLPVSRTSQGKDLAIEYILYHFGDCPAVRDNFGKGTIRQEDGTEKQFKENIPLSFRVQKGIHKCD